MATRAPSITTPALDVILTGGLSLLAMVFVLIWAFGLGGSVDFGDKVMGRDLGVDRVIGPKAFEDERGCLGGKRCCHTQKLIRPV